ncbi:zonadhesin [Octopus sinensis]|uniref:Zonadhesin n=1 Tax=Octopus sinensis TaxID=2607531 RepID=A0A6P7T5Y1_9MOLL|nr:zonadhesin [Octopus sinensis]
MKIVLLLASCLCAVVFCQDTTSDGLNRYRREIKYDSYLMNVAIPGSVITKTWFIEVKHCYIPIHTYIDIHRNSSLTECAYQCLLTHGCRSFEFGRKHNNCFLSHHNGQQTKAKYSYYRDFYQLLNPNEEFIKILGVSIRNHDLQRIHNVGVEDCLDKCRTLSYCNVMEYKKQHNKCDLSNVTYSKYPISVNYFGWDFYQKNPTFCDLKCGPMERCKIENSQKKCVCYPGCIKLPSGKGCYEKPPLKCNNCKCSASGDPHYRTFDGQLIHFMGTCKYTLARSLQSKGAGFFNVEVKNENRGNAKVSYTRMVDIILEGVRIRLLPKLKIRVNNRNVEAPVRNKKLGFTIRLSNRWIHVETSFNLRVSFDGKHRVRVSIPRKTFGGRMTGLCGDCNGHRDDLRTSNGTVVVHKKNKFSLIGESYRVTDDSDMPKLRCEEKDPNPDDECKLNGQKYCDIIRNPRGMFGKCIEKLGATDVREFYESCLYDYCFYANSTIIESIVCASLESFAAECESAGVVYNWRFLTNCPMDCSENMEYKYRASGCQPTCVEANPDCTRTEIEGCVCKPGYVLSGEKCIKPHDCGCTYDEFYIKLGKNLTLPGCDKIVVCEKDGSARGRRKIVDIEGCVVNSQCITRDGVWQCVCNKGFAYNDNKTECEKVPVCGVEPIDIQFVVDISNSIREEGLYETKKFLTEFVNASIISSTQAQLGILLFNSKVSNKFFIDDAKTKEEIKDAIETIGPVHSGTRLSAALRFTSTSALSLHTVRKDVKRVVIVITDGQISNKQEVARWSKHIRVIRNARIVIIAVGRTDDALLGEMTSDGGKVLHASRYDTLQRVIDDLYRVVCK